MATRDCKFGLPDTRNPGYLGPENPARVLQIPDRIFGYLLQYIRAEEKNLTCKIGTKNKNKMFTHILYTFQCVRGEPFCGLDKVGNTLSHQLQLLFGIEWRNLNSLESPH